VRAGGPRRRPRCNHQWCHQHGHARSNYCWGFHVSHTDPRRQGPHSLFRPVRTDLHQWKYGDGCFSPSIPPRRHPRFVLERASLRFLYDVTIPQISYKGSGYHYLPLCFITNLKGRSDDLSLSRRSSLPGSLITNTSSLGKPIYYSVVHLHALHKTNNYTLRRSKLAPFVSVRDTSQNYCHHRATNAAAGI
jgi:hypothetical protein